MLTDRQLDHRIRVSAAWGMDPVAICCRHLCSYRRVAAVLGLSGPAPAKPPVAESTPPAPQAPLTEPDAVAEAIDYLAQHGCHVARAAGAYWLGDRELTAGDVIARAERKRRLKAGAP